ncbi:MAG TPA: DegT/DnrJ/EryC1/StrS family aminotransferase [Acidimicrobiales bacterium]
MDLDDRPAVLGGTPVTVTERWPRWPQWDHHERDELVAALDEGGWWTGDGVRAQTFADRFAVFHGARFGLPFTNGTHTLEGALVACDVGEGDEVLVPGLTFVASATAVLAVNAVPVLVDIDAATLNIDVSAAAAAIGPRTKAIVAVHVAGAACDIDALLALCERHDLHLIEDCAHAHGTLWRGRGVGSWGSFGSFSMQRSKLMTAGEGGVLVCNDDDLRARAWSYWNCGRVEGEHWYHHASAGSNMRMTEWQGAVLLAQLDRFLLQAERRDANARLLAAALERVPGLQAQARDPRMERQGYYCFVFHYDAAEFAGLPLRGFERAVAAEGIPLGVSYPALNTLEVFRTNRFGPRLRHLDRDYSRVSLPAAEHAARSTVWMEHRVLLAEPDDVLLVAQACERVHRHASAIAASDH